MVGVDLPSQPADSLSIFLLMPLSGKAAARTPLEGARAPRTSARKVTLGGTPLTPPSKGLPVRMTSNNKSS